jgi:hypothetical protein
MAVVGVEDGDSDGFNGEEDSVGVDDLFDEADGELDVDVAGGGCDGFEFVLEVDDSVEVAGGAVLECVDESGGLASDTAAGVGAFFAVVSAVSEGGADGRVAGASAVVDGVGVASHFVSHFLGVVMMMRAAQIVMRTTQIPERRRISVSLICGLR